MNGIAIALLVVMTLLTVGLLLMSSRLQKVMDYRTNLLEEMLKAIGTPDFERQLTRFQSVTFYEMVFRFWKPLDSFYSASAAKPDDRLTETTNEDFSN